MFKLLLAIIFLCISTVAQAMDGNELYKKYGAYYWSSRVENANWLDTGIFMGFVDGVSVTSLVDGVSANSLDYCPPEDVIYTQLYDIVGQYLTNHPERRQNRAVFLVKQALIEAFPCKKSKSGK